jgi:hypothetical protein
VSGKPEEADKGRRSFLKLAAMSAPAAAATAAGTAADAETDEDTSKGTGLRKTPHVKAYLASARF